MKHYRPDPYLLLTLLISAVAALPLVGPYFVGSHDGILAVYRFFEFDRSIQEGILVPRWAPDLFFGYGYPFFNFYAPLSYYVAEAFHLLGLGFVASISATFALGFALSGVFMYLFVRDIAGRWAGTLAALAYVFAPYHLVNAHLRGDLAEFFAFAWFPAILWAAGRLMNRGSLGYLGLTAIFYGALLTTHNIMALAFSPLLAAYLAFLLVGSRVKGPGSRVRGQGSRGDLDSRLSTLDSPLDSRPPTPSSPLRQAAYGFLAVALAFGLSAFFWMPALLQVDDIQIGRLANDPSFYYRTSLMQWSGYVSDAVLQDYGPRSTTGDFGYPVELGLLQTLLAAAAAGLLAWRRRLARSTQRTTGRGEPSTGAPASRRPRWPASNPSVGDARKVAGETQESPGKALARVGEAHELPLQTATTGEFLEPPLQRATGAGHVHVGHVHVGTEAKEGLGPLLFLAAAALAYYAIMFPWALVLWEKVPLMSYLQSPWRLLPFLTLSIAALTGYLGLAASRLRPGWNAAALAVLALLVTVPNVINLQPRYVDLRESEVSVSGTLRFELQSQNLGLTAAGEYLPKGVRSKMGASPPVLDALSQEQPLSSFDSSFLARGGEAEVMEARGALARFRVRSPEGTPFLYNQTYFPGWTAYIDGQEVPLKGVGTANLMTVQAPPGPHFLEFRFQDTRARLLGQAISLASLAILLLLTGLAICLRLGMLRSTANQTQAPSSTTKHNEAPSSTNKHYQAQPLVPLAIVLAILAAIFLSHRAGLPGPGEASWPVEAAWRGGPALRGYDLSASDLRPGQEMDLTLYWSGTAVGREVRIGLKGRTGKVWGQNTAAVRSTAADGAPQRDLRQVTLPADIPPGMYQISLEVLEDSKPLPLVREDLARPVFPEKTLLLGPVFVGRGDQASAERVAPSMRREVNLEDKAMLLGYDLAMGERRIDLSTYWKSLSVMREDYSIFAHLLDMGEKVLVYQDLQPEGNPFPTTLWRPGDVVTVPFHFDLPPDFAPEKYRIALGFYTPNDFQRLSVLDPAGQPVTNTVFVALPPSANK